MSSVRFDTTQYEFAHGRQPRGNGGWAFRPYRSKEDFVFFYGSYADAKRQAREWARARGVDAVEVGS